MVAALMGQGYRLDWVGHVEVGQVSPTFTEICPENLTPLQFLRDHLEQVLS